MTLLRGISRHSPIIFIAASILCVILGFLAQGPASVSSGPAITLTSGGAFLAKLGDEITVRPLCHATVTLRYGLTDVAEGDASPTHAFSWRALGSDQYSVILGPDCFANITVAHKTPKLSPLLTGLAWFSATLLLLAATRRFWNEPAKSVARGRLMDAAAVATASAALFSLIPAYLHNDEVGAGLTRNWGYRGWGYADTLTAVAHAIHVAGLTGLITVQSFGKPIAMQLLVAALTAGFLTGTIAAQLFSALFAVAAAIAIYLLGTTLGGRRLGGMASVAFFLLDPIFVAYSRSFYGEIGWLAGFTWACVFLNCALHGRGRWYWFAGALAMIFAVSSKHLLIAPMTMLMLFFVLSALGNGIWKSALAALAAGALSVVGSLAAWPFLWDQSPFRVSFVLGGRVVFDEVHGFVSPLWVRGLHDLLGSILRLSPMEAAALLGGAYLAFLRRQRPVAFLFGALIVASAISLPTGFPLQHYLLYALPCISLICAAAVLNLTERWIRPALCVAVGGQILILALFWPYVGTASLGCFTPQCSFSRGLMPEPVYGLREAAKIIGSRANRGDVVLSFAAPHVLQSYLPEQQVLFLPSFPASQQRRLLRQLGARFVVTNGYSQSQGVTISSSALHEIATRPPRYGKLSVFETAEGIARTASPDISQQTLRSVGIREGDRVVLISDGYEVKNDGIPTTVGLLTIPPFSPPSEGAIGAGYVITRATRASAVERMQDAPPITTLPGGYDLFGNPMPPLSMQSFVESHSLTKFGTLKLQVPAPTKGFVRIFVGAAFGASLPNKASFGCVWRHTDDVRLNYSALLPQTMTALITPANSLVKECARRGSPLTVEAVFGKNAKAPVLAAYTALPSMPSLPQIFGAIQNASTIDEMMGTSTLQTTIRATAATRSLGIVAGSDDGRYLPNKAYVSCNAILQVTAPLHYGSDRFVQGAIPGNDPVLKKCVALHLPLSIVVTVSSKTQHPFIEAVGTSSVKLQRRHSL